ncbi:phage terminase large subunit [Limnohabitans sp.]|uniref:phage terminase large subunit n=1 Tax=Limnohabitans sp. TaxID=1907725 RepID=UPI00286F03BB|nr:phage terminase large subunit [Limnohabitans sp.]
MAKQKQLRDKDFLAELAAYAHEQRTLIEAECDGFATDFAARDKRATRAHNDYEFFCRTYFPHYVKSEPSAFHRWFFDTIPVLIDKPEGQLIEVSAPRGEAKSTLGTQLATLWVVVTGRKRFIPLVMDSFDQTATMLEAVKVELESNPRLSMDFPDACGKGRVWNAGVIVTRNNAKVQAFGSGKKMRGLRHGPHRPDFVLLDDIENDENVRSKEQRDKLEQWLKKVVLPLGPPDGSMDVLYLNTILHYDSVANRVHKNPSWKRVKFSAVVRWPDRMDLWQQWEELYINEGEEIADTFYNQRRADMDAGSIVSWPTMRPLLKLMKIRAGDHHAFDCEYQNDPTNDEASFFQGMKFWVQPSRDWVFYGAHDPSLGKNNKSRDPSACLVGGFDRNHGVLSVVEATVARMIPDRQISKIIEYQRDYRCLVWGIESIQFQEFFRQELIKSSAKAGVPVPAIALTPNTDKNLRIESLSPHVNNGLILFHQAHTVLNSQLRHWPEADHDDGPDALHMLWMLCLTRAGGTPKIRLGARGIPNVKTYHQPSN